MFQNSIRHNLSLHNRFMRVQNEGTGKSSWWMINPDAKPGKSVRRRAASMETSKFEKRRGRVKKKVRRHCLGRVCKSNSVIFFVYLTPFIRRSAMTLKMCINNAWNQCKNTMFYSIGENLNGYMQRQHHATRLVLTGPSEFSDLQFKSY